MSVRRSGIFISIVPFVSLVLAPVLCGSHAGETAVSGKVETYGSLREIIHQGRTEGRVPLSIALTQPHAYALGARARLDGEFIILNGQVFESRPGRQGRAQPVAYDAAHDSAALLVVAHVPQWRDVHIRRPIPVAALRDALAARATALGLNPSGPFPFLIEGPVTGLRWHVADGRRLPPGPSSHEAHAKAAVHGGARATSVKLVGFYSDHHQGVFTHHDSDVHLHVLVEKEGLAAHVDSLCVSPGAVLRLPVAQ